MALAVALAGCLPLNDVACDAVCQTSWIDGGNVRDTADLVSRRYPQPDSALRERPVLIVAHGFTASTYEWEEFQRFAAARGPVLVSRVLLGGHGTGIADFEGSTWRDWGAPVAAEYRALARAGYRRISLAGSSTGATLILNHLRDGVFDTLPPRHVFLIDPIIVPGDKLLSAIALGGPVVGNVQADNTPAEAAHWYTNRPAETLAQLYDLINRVKNRLEDGYRLPPGTRAKVYKALHDDAADPVSALLIYKGLKRRDGGRIDAEMIDTDKHVFTRLQGRAHVNAADSALQRRVFAEMEARLTE